MQSTWRSNLVFQQNALVVWLGTGGRTIALVVVVVTESVALKVERVSPTSPECEHADMCNLNRGIESADVYFRRHTASDLREEKIGCRSQYLFRVAMLKSCRLTNPLENNTSQVERYCGRNRVRDGASLLSFRRFMVCYCRFRRRFLGPIHLFPMIWYYLRTPTEARLQTNSLFSTLLAAK